MEIKIKATTFEDGRIVVSDQIADKLKGNLGTIASKTIETEDQLVKAALVSLGWTPPAIDSQESLNLEKLEDGEFYPLIDCHGRKGCMVYSLPDEKFWHSDDVWGFDASLAIWVGNKIQFPGELR